MTLLKRIVPKTLARLLGIMYFIFGALLSIIFGIIAITPGQGTEEFSSTDALFFVIAIPVFYGILGWAGGYATAWLYNIITKRFGGIEFELESTADVLSQTSNQS